MRITEDTSPTWPLKAAGLFIFLYVRCIAERSAELFDLGKPCVFIICVAVNGQISAQDFRSGRSRQVFGQCVIRLIELIIKICHKVLHFRPFCKILTRLCYAAVNAKDTLGKGFVRMSSR